MSFSSVVCRSVARVAANGGCPRVSAAAPAFQLRRSFGDDPATALKDRERSRIQLSQVSKTDAEVQHDSALKGTIVVEGAADVTPVSGVPEEHVKERCVEC